jgi:hypothetical protein
MGNKIRQKIDIFISSPSDVRTERQIALDVIARLNRLSHIDSLEQTFGLSLDALAIFKEDEAVRETGIARLWEALGAIAAHIIGIGGEWKWSRIQVVLKD